MQIPPINLWSIPKQLRDYMRVRTYDMTDHEKAMQQAEPRKFSRYFKDVSKKSFIDVYDVLELFGVRRHAVGHAIKKCLCAGVRGSKTEAIDIKEAIASLERYLEMIEEKE